MDHLINSQDAGASLTNSSTLPDQFRLKGIHIFMRIVVPLLVIATSLIATPAASQIVDLNPSQTELSRAELDSLLAQFEETAASSAYSGALRERARADAMLIRRRIESGDFQIGDQISLVVENEPSLTSTFVVQAGPSLTLPAIGSISLAGVLRSELQDHLRTELGRYLRNPVVQARASIRLLITGNVVRAGYHVVSTNTVFADILSDAGGATALADLERIRVERGNQVIWDHNTLRQATIEGRTLDQLSIQAGDHIVVPEQTGGTGGSVLRVITTIVAPVALLIVAVMQAF